MLSPPEEVVSTFVIFLSHLTNVILFLSVPAKSLLQPPKLAPSAWQLYFTDWISNHQANSDRKLNVAQAAKEAGQEYATLTDAEKEVCGRLSVRIMTF